MIQRKTKAQRIFDDTRFECYDHIKTWGAKRENGKMIGFNRCDYRDNECMTQRTINALRQILESRKRDIKMAYKLNIINEEKYEFESDILEMVEVTIDNNERAMKS